MFFYSVCACALFSVCLFLSIFTISSVSNHDSIAATWIGSFWICQSSVKWRMQLFSRHSKKSLTVHRKKVSQTNKKKISDIYLLQNKKKNCWFIQNLLQFRSAQQCWQITHHKSFTETSLKESEITKERFSLLSLTRYWRNEND